jgi:hypothetical protein
VKEKGDYIMIVTAKLSKDAKLTEEQVKEIEEAKKYPITYDEDCPELTPEMEKQFKVVAKMRNRLLNRKEA